MTNHFKKVIDRQMWVQITPTPNAHAAGVSFSSDLRNDISRNPFVYQLVSAALLNRYNIVTKSWKPVVNPGLGGTFGAGAGTVFAPSFSVVGQVTTGSTPSLITTKTVLPVAVGINMLANRGASGDYGYKIRVISYTTGKTEERWIIGNTAGTTPSIDVDVPFTFTPANNDRYEILSGKVYMLSAGTLAATSFRSFETVINRLENRGTTNLPATIGTEFSAVALDEQYVPYTRKPGEGFIVGTGTYDLNCTCGIKNCLTATATAAGTITGQASAGDSVVIANEYRNFQIRIVEDTVNVTAVGQRRIIASHTGGASPVYTLGSNWTVTPSANAKYVIENPNLILLWSSATTTTYTFNYSDASITNGTGTIAADAWNTTYFAARGSAMGAGCTSFASFGIEPDISRNARHSFVHSFRGGNVVTLDILNIAGAINGTWENGAVYDGGYIALNTGSCGKYAPVDNEGRFGYLNIYVASGLNQIYRYDVKNRVFNEYTPTDWIQAGTAAAGDRVATYAVIDGEDRYTVVLLLAHLSTIAQELIVQV